MFFIKKTFKNNFVGSLRLGASTFWLPQPNPPNSKGDLYRKNEDKSYKKSRLLSLFEIFGTVLVRVGLVEVRVCFCGCMIKSHVRIAP